MEELLAYFTDPNLLYLILIVASWVGVLVLFVPGTGVMEVLAGAGLLLGIGGLASAGAGIVGLLFFGISLVLYGLAIMSEFVKAEGRTGWLANLPLSPFVLALVSTVLQAVGGLVMASELALLAVWLVVALALSSLAIFRWMLVPSVKAMRPQPVAGIESLIGQIAEVRRLPEGPGKPAMVYFNGELWQALSDEVLTLGETVEVLSRDGMRLRVRRTAGTGQG